MDLSIKKKLLKKLKSFPKIKVNKIQSVLMNYEYVSFDIFDTLIKRNVEEPNDVFELVALEIKRKYGWINHNFRELRIRSEKEARLLSKNGEEITLDDIYTQIRRNIDTNIDDRIINEIKELECEIEKVICCPNTEIKKIYDWCITNKKKVIIISDMYLPEELIEKMLVKCGYTEYLKLYLSSSITFKKRTGKLFDYVLKDLDIESKSIIHIGDSIKSDFIGARNRKIKTILIPKYINHLSHHDIKNIDDCDKFAFNTIRAMTNNLIQVEKNEYYKFGYEAFGPLLFGFNKWLFEDINKRGIKKIFFFSRDGHIIKRAYNEMFQYRGIEVKYLYVSRRSLRVPQIWINPELEEVVKGFPLAKLLTVDTFIKNLGLDSDYYKESLKEYGLSLDTEVRRSEIIYSKNLVKFYSAIKDDVIKNSKKEYELLLQYLKQNDFCGDVAVVDIGWHGTLQYFLQRLVEQANLDVKMHGYYIGLAKEAKTQLDIKGYVIDKNSRTNSCDSWKSFNGLVETIFLAQEGSTEKFHLLEKGVVVPQLYKYEYMNNDRFEPEAIKVKEIQDGAIQFINDLCNIEPLYNLEFNSNTAFERILRIGNYPTKQHIQLFSNFRFLEEQIDYLAMPKSILYYILHPRKLAKDLLMSRWKVGFMKKLFKIPLPYVKIYKFLSRK